MGNVITIFGSSRPLPDSEEYQTAFAAGRSLARRGFTVCNGAYGGTMEAASKGAREAGGSTIGVTSAAFSRTPNSWVEKEIRTETMVERLLKLVELGKGYVVLKGGTGTLLELAAVWEFINKGFQPRKPIVVVGTFWNAVIETMRSEQIWEGSGDCAEYITHVQTPEACAEHLFQALGAG